MAPERTSGVDRGRPVAIAAKPPGNAGAGERVEQRGPGGREAGRPALPERRVRRERQQQWQMVPHPVEQAHGGGGCRHAHVDVRRERRLTSRQHAHRLVDLAIARVGRGHHGLVPRRRGVGSSGRGDQPVTGEQCRDATAELRQLCDGVGDAPVRARGDFHHTGVRLERHAAFQVGRQPGDHLIRPEGKRPVVWIEEHELFLDPDREVARSRASSPRRPRREIDMPVRARCSPHAYRCLSCCGHRRSARLDARQPRPRDPRLRCLTFGLLAAAAR